MRPTTPQRAVALACFFSPTCTAVVAWDRSAQRSRSSKPPRRPGHTRGWCFRKDTGFTALGIRKVGGGAAGAEVEGVLFEVDEALDTLDEREAGYDRVQVLPPCPGLRCRLPPSCSCHVPLPSLPPISAQPPRMPPSPSKCAHRLSIPPVLLPPFAATAAVRCRSPRSSCTPRGPRPGRAYCSRPAHSAGSGLACRLVPPR